jgi:hypothetical protein
MKNHRIDFCIGWGPWDTDPFLNHLKEFSEKRRLNCVVCGDEDARKILRGLERGSVEVSFHLDCNADYDEPGDLYAQLAYALRDDGALCVNEPDYARLGCNKAVLHYDFERAGIPVPFTVVVRNWVNSDFRLTSTERKKLGRPFIVKPARGYGKQGVARVNSGSIKEIARARRFDQGDDFLLQEIITPEWFGHLMGWFRVYYLFGQVIPCWWDTRTEHIVCVTRRHFDEFGLQPLCDIMWKVAETSRMNFYSTEIAVARNSGKRRFVAIDYVNDPPDMSLQSFTHCGVPDVLVRHIAERLAETALRVKHNEDPVDGRSLWFPD